MGKIIAIYGTLGGIVVAVGMWVGMLAVPDGGSLGMVVGYLTMLVAMSMVFAGTKKFRDQELGGVIRFWPALGVGLAIALIASLFYVLTWEAYMAYTNYTFIDEYAASAIKSMKAEGKSAAEIAKFSNEMAQFAKDYAKPAYRMMITLSEIAPVAIFVSLVSAAMLRNPRFMPAKTR